MNLQQLKDHLIETADMTGIYEKIKVDAREQTSVYFRDLDKLQIAHLEDNGYDVIWDRACTWYEVSGWL